MTASIIQYRRSIGGAAVAALVLSLTANPAAAQQEVTDDTVSAREVAMTPLSDLNLARDAIPSTLVRARAAPYANEGYDDCTEVRREIGDLDAVLGDDFDTAPPEEREFSAGEIAQRVVAHFIPFRGIIREISGANEHEYEFREAITAGLMRRAYLKGIGQQMGCSYPARPAPPALVARLESPAPSEPQAEAIVAAAAADTPAVSRPVVQSTD